MKERKMKMILRVGLSAYSAMPTLQQQVLGDQMWFGLGSDLLIPSFNKYLVPLYPVPGIGL